MSDNVNDGNDDNGFKVEIVDENTFRATLGNNSLVGVKDDAAQTSTVNYTNERGEVLSVRFQEAGVLTLAINGQTFTVDNLSNHHNNEFVAHFGEIILNAADIAFPKPQFDAAAYLRQVLGDAVPSAEDETV